VFILKSTVAAKADRLRGHLENLNISHLAEWDVLAFIYRHGSSLVRAEQLGRLVGYQSAVVAAALNTLTSTGLVVRSRNSRGVHLYRFNATLADDARRLSLTELLVTGAEREGRLLLIEHLRPLAEQELRRRNGWHLA
jgi:DNA-binding MarR family transcriptional regulator